MVFDDYIHIQYERLCIIMTVNRKCVDTKYTLFTVLVVALVANYSLKLRNICFELQDFQRRRSLERTPEPQPQPARTNSQRLHASYLP